MHNSAKEPSIFALQWYLVVFAVLPFLGNSATVACGGDGCSCDDAVRSLNCVGLNLSFVPLVSTTGFHSLNLSDNQIRQVTDDDFVHFTELRYLDLSRNRLLNISSNAFSHSVHLRRLVLNDNDLTADVILSAGGAPLRELYLSTNRIDALDELTVFSSLSTLDVSGNELVRVPETFLVGLPNLQRLNLAGNQIEEFLVTVESDGVLLRELNLSSNSLAHFSISGQLRYLEVLDLSWNQLSLVDLDSMDGMPNLLVLILSGNPVEVVPDFAFQSLPSLEAIEMSFLQNVTSISANVFAGLDNLHRLQLADNPRLGSISNLTFRNTTQLRDLDLSGNNLSSINAAMFSALRQLEVFDISDNPWPCDCVLFMELLSLENDVCHRNSSCVLEVGPVCWVAEESSVANSTSDHLDCRKARVADHTKDARHGIGSSAVLDCTTSGQPHPQIIWVTNRNLMMTYSEFDAEQGLAEGLVVSGVDSYLQEYEQHERMAVLSNGSLYIAYVTRKEGGTYRCIAANEHGNETVFVEFHLNYEVMSTVTVMSIIVGFLTATGFFLIAVVIGAVRYLSFVCSAKERKKRKSIREVLDSINDFKSAQFDKLSAYRTAKMDQLSAFKSAKIDQFSAFRHQRIGKLRTYKQATVTSVLQYLERMREHYTNQTVRIKDNCTQQMDKLRDSYGIQRGKFKDYRSHQVEKMRDNYNAQVLKIREYSVQQTLRLREQYKAQQQNVLKLLELLDIGNCVMVIEAECIHTESIIFDASIAFDYEAHPIHVPRGDADSTLSDESHYLTASESGSESDLPTNPHSISFAADVEPGIPGSDVRFPDFQPTDSFGDSMSDIFLESFPLDPMEFPEMPDIDGVAIGGRSRSFLPTERETEC